MGILIVLGALAWLVIAALAYLLGPAGFGILLIVLGAVGLLAGAPKARARHR